ncbi:MAG: hypothetical protein WCQ16_03150 [Verrucomicrobiae bacterium]
MEFPAPYHTTPESQWAKLAKDRKRNPKKIPKPIKAMRIKGAPAQRKKQVGQSAKVGKSLFR